MANTSLRREVSVTGNRKTFTFSAWVKKTKIADNQNIFSQYVGSGSANIATHFRIRFQTTDALAVATGGTDLLVTNAVYRDTNAWYHVVCAVDTTQSTADDRVKLYVNGEQITSFASRNNPSQDVDTVVNLAGSSHYPRIGADDSDGAGPYNFFDGLMSHVHFVDGTAYPASTFGSTDSVTGEWQLNTAPVITMGTNGFTILKDGNTITDQSTNSNDFISLGAGVTNTEDNPSNVFATINGLFQPDPSNGTFSTTNGGLSFTTNFTSQSIMGVTTIGATSGKYYAEFKLTGESGSGEAFAGIGYDIYDQATSSINADSSFMWNVCSNGASKQGGSEQPSGNWSNLYTTNDIISIAMDLDNNRVYFAKNGQYADGSGNWDEAFTGSPAYATITADKTYFFCAGDKSTSTNASWSCNFGNGFFGTTQISSEGTNASGIGKFEYDVPTGYTALSTKGLNE
jgi:hypothetical protein